MALTENEVEKEFQLKEEILKGWRLFQYVRRRRDSNNGMEPETSSSWWIYE